jgi:hypothetical protein
MNNRLLYLAVLYPEEVKYNRYTKFISIINKEKQHLNIITPPTGELTG